VRDTAAPNVAAPTMIELHPNYALRSPYGTKGGGDSDALGGRKVAELILKNRLYSPNSIFFPPIHHHHHHHYQQH
jgi:hypothetical protein